MYIFVQGPVVKIDIVSDVVCPWCVIGFKNLQKALSELDSKVDFEISWKPYELHPEIPENGYDSVNEFSNKISQSVSWPSQVLSINSKTLLISTKVYNQTFSNQLDSLVILDISNSAKVLNRDFSF